MYILEIKKEKNMFTSLLMHFMVWITLINIISVRGDELIPVANPVNVKETQTVTLEWRSDFALSREWYLHVKFRPPGQKDFSRFPIATLVDERPSKNNKMPRFYQKITTVTVSKKSSNSFHFKVTISNMAITEEGEYQIIRLDPLGIYGYIESIVNAGVIVRPQINPFPKDVVQQEGHTSQLKCTITAGNPKPLNFRWLFTPIGKNAVQKPLTDFIKAVDTVYYNLTKVSYRSKGKYTCVVSNGFGEKDSHDINFSVLHRPYIDTPIMNATVFESDGTKEMNCDAIGNPATERFYWYKGPNRIQIKSSTANLILEKTGSQLRFINPTRDMATLYSCAGENVYGIGDSRGAYLIVTYVPEPVEFPEITNKVANIMEGHNITVKCYSDAVPPAMYSWYRKYKDDIGQVREMKIDEDNKSGLMTLHNVMINDTGEYKCIAYNYPDGKNPKQQYFKQDIMKIKVMFGPLRTNITVNGFNQSSKVVQVTENEKVVINCESDSEPAATYIIQHNNIQLNTDGAVGHYRIDKMTVDKDGDYLCIATNQDLRTKETRIIKVLTAIAPKSAVPYPTDKEANEGATVRMECNAEGRPAPNVFWTRNGLNLTNFNDGVITTMYKVTRIPPTLTDTSNKLYRIQAVLIFTGIRPSDEGHYQCVIYNGAGREIISAKYTVNYAPKFLKPLQNYTVKELTPDVVFTCSVDAKPDTNILYRWFFNGVEQSITTSSFVRKIANRAVSGRYMCQAKNLVGSRNSTIGTLIVTYAPEITYITPQTIVDPFQSVTLRCQVNGVPAPEVSWSKDDDPDFKYFGNDLIINSIKNSDRGLYHCEAKNSDGGDSKSVKLLVRHKPVIATTSPAETKIGVDIGNSVILTCRADGYPLPDITWREKGASSDLANGVGPFTIDVSESVFGRQSKLKFIASSIGTIYVCNAKNELDKSDSQEFQVLGKGPPDPPVKINTPTDELQANFPIVVNISLSWVPGFSGGYPVTYTLYYREKNDFTDRSFERYEIGATQENKFFFTNRKPSTTYELSMSASNIAGKSVISKAITFKTRDAPPPVADVEFTMGNDKKSIIVKWLITKDPLPTSNRFRRNTGSIPLKWKYAIIRYQVVNSGTWSQERIDDIKKNGTRVVSDLDESESYNVHFVLYDTHGNHATPVGITDPIRLGEPKAAARSGLSQTDIIAIAVGCGGALLLIVVILLFIIIHKKNSSNKSKTYNDPRVQVDIPANTMRSNYSGDVVRSSYINEDDPYALELTDVDDSKSPPPGYDGLHHYADPPRDYGDNVYRPSGFKSSVEPTPSYTSFGRISKKDRPEKDANDYNTYSQSMNQLNNGPRAAEISRGNERHRYSLDNLDDYPEDVSRPLIQKNQRPPNVRTSRGRLSSEDDMPEPPFMKDNIRSPPSDEGALNRAPGAFGDRAQRFKKPPQKTYNQPPPPPPNGFHQGVNGRDSPAPSSVASSKPYRSDNEYIDEQDDKYVGFLV